MELRHRLFFGRSLSDYVMNAPRSPLIRAFDNYKRMAARSSLDFLDKSSRTRTKFGQNQK